LNDVQRQQERFCQLYQAAAPSLTAYAGRRCQERSDSDDVVSEVFLVAWRRIEDVPDGDAALPWLYGVARQVSSWVPSAATDDPSPHTLTSPRPT
jgi:DNA-directed RNA polymerase specialized sigma24 family protein